MTKIMPTAEALELLNNQPVVTGKQAAQILGLSPVSIYRQLDAGTFPFPSLRVGGRHIIPTAPLLQLITGKQAA